MVKVKTQAWDAAKYLKSEEDIKYYAPAGRPARPKR
jgi:hypothetical protein